MSCRPLLRRRHVCRHSLAASRFCSRPCVLPVRRAPAALDACRLFRFYRRGVQLTRMLRCSLQRRPSSRTAAAVCTMHFTTALRCAPLPRLHMHCSAFAPHKPCSNHRTSHPHCCARYRCLPSFQIAQREAVSRCISQAAARAGDAAARRHQGCKRELNPRAAVYKQPAVPWEQCKVITTIFPRIYARTYYAHPRARVMSFSGDCLEGAAMG